MFPASSFSPRLMVSHSEPQRPSVTRTTSPKSTHQRTFGLSNARSAEPPTSVSWVHTDDPLARRTPSPAPDFRRKRQYRPSGALRVRSALTVARGGASWATPSAGILYGSSRPTPEKIGRFKGGSRYCLWVNFRPIEDRQPVNMHARIACSRVQDELIHPVLTASTTIGADMVALFATSARSSDLKAT